MQRIKFPKTKQREFLDNVLQNLNSPSLRNLLQFIPTLKYSSLKDYYTERRLIPESLLNDLLHLSKLQKPKNIQILTQNWGQVKGGKISKRKPALI